MAVELRPAYVKVAGQQKQVKAAYVKASGAWKEITRAYTKVNGVWKVIWAPTEVNLTFVQCIDHFSTVHYFASGGRGQFYVASREPSMQIHSSRGDCGSAPQGFIQWYTFDLAGKSNMDITITMSGRCGTRSIRLVQSVLTNTTTSARDLITDWYGGAAAYTFTIAGTIN